jgi:hypothetical protein
LSRLYHPTPDELQGAKPLWEGGWGSDDNRGSWFYNYQDLLVRLANTDYGRDLLRIDKLPYPVIAVRKNMIQFDMSRDLGPGYACADVRSGARWGDIIRFRWLAVKQALDRMNLEVLLAMPKYIMHKGRRAPVLMGAASIEKYPDADPEDATFDGDLTFDTVVAGGITWSAIYSGPPTTIADSSPILDLMVDSDSVDGRWDFLLRAFMLFDTSALGAGATITSATLQFVLIQRSDDFNASLYLVTSTPANDDELVIGDWGEIQAVSQATTPTFASFTLHSASAGFYNSLTLNATGEGNISKTGITKFGFRVDTDATGSGPTWTSQYRSHLGMAAADTDLGDDKRIKLVVVYTLAVTPKVIMF